MVIDAHHAWDLYHPLTSPTTLDPESGEVRILMDLPLELMGLPKLNVGISLLSPLGVRVSSALSEENINNESYWENYVRYSMATTLLRPVIEEPDFPTDTKRMFSSKGGHLAQINKSGAVVEERSVKKIPNISGLSSRLRRRKGVTLLQAEIDASLLNKNPREDLLPDPCHLGPLLDKVLLNLKGPIHEERDLPFPHIQMSDLAHSLNYKNVKVLPNCLLELKDPVVSRKVVYGSLKEVGALERIWKKFLEELEQAKRVSFPAWAESLVVEVQREVSFLKEATETLWRARLEKDYENFPHAEMLKNQGQGNIIQMRILHL